MVAMDAVINGQAAMIEGIEPDDQYGPHLSITNSTPPANDDFGSPETITIDLNTPGRMIGSTIEGDEFTSAIFSGSEALFQATYPYTVWYTYTPPSDMTVDITMDLTDAAVGFIVYSDGGPTQTDLVYEGSTGLATRGIHNFLELHLTGGVQYYIQFVQPTGDNTALAYDPISDLGDGEFSFVLSRAALNLEAEIDGTSSMSISVTTPLEATSSGSATMSITGTFGSALSATVNGGSSVVLSILEINNNPRVEPYEFDPGAGAGGSVTADPGPVPNIYLNETGVALQEAVGAGMDSKFVTEYVAVLAQDIHSSDAFLGFLDAPIPKVGSTPVYSYERWVRVRFQYPFNTVDGLRVWTPTDLSWLGAGWTFKVGFTDTYSTPVNTASSIATGVLPTSDPGIPSRNMMGSSVEIGTSTDFFSKWLVIQASIDPTVATTGNAFGFTPEGLVPVPLDLQFAWIET